MRLYVYKTATFHLPPPEKVLNIRTHVPRKFPTIPFHPFFAIRLPKCSIFYTCSHKMKKKKIFSSTFCVTLVSG